MPIFRRRRADADFSAEVQAHLALETDRLIAEGLSPDDARALAHRAFGNVTRVREESFERGRWMWLEHMRQDLRYAARGLCHHPAFLVTSVSTLAVALGLVSVAFTLFNAYVLRPYAVRDPYSLHEIEWRTPGRVGNIFRWRDYLELRDRPDLFSDVLAEGVRPMSSDGRTLAAALVSDNYFEALAPAMHAGRPLGIGDGPSGAPVVVLGYHAWKRLYGGADAVGRSIDLNGHDFLVVGVAGPDFGGLGESPCDIWLPFTTYAALVKPALVGAEQPQAVAITVRLRPEMSATVAGQALAGFVTLAVGGTETVRAELTPRASPAPFTLDLLGAFAIVTSPFVLVLVTACANLSNVMFARAFSRRREIAMRLSLGASRSRIVGQLLTEGLLVAVLGGLVGLALAHWALQGALALLVSTLPPAAASMLRFMPMSLDHRVFAFAMLAAASATLMFALLPALDASRLPLNEAMRGHAGSPRRTSRFRNALVISQVAVSLVLVVSAITLARNGWSLGHISLGYRTEGVVSINLRDRDGTPLQRLQGVLEADSRVESVAVTSGNPLFVIDMVAGRGDGTRMVLASPEGDGEVVRARYTFVSPGYFSLLQLPLVRGRGFDVGEAHAAAPVTVVSAATADTFWPGEDPIGKRVRIERPDGRAADDLPEYPQATVVGVVADHVSGMVIEGPDRAQLYLPIDDAHPRAVALLVRERPGQHLTAVALQRMFGAVSSDPQAFEALTLNEMRALQAYPLQAAAWVGSILSLVALALGISGLYGVLVYTLSQRTREIGIRMALGAGVSAVVRLVVGQSAKTAGIGAVLGLATAFGVMQLLSAYVRMYDVTWLDAPAFVGGLVLVVSAAVLAAYRPARRAARVDPAEVLRVEA